MTKSTTVNESSPHRLQILQLACLPYQTVWERMQTFTSQRTDTTPDQLWLLEHDPVFTQGRAGKQQHLLDAGHIPVVRCDRGGQITYHGPGQLITYCLIDLPRRQLSVRQLIQALEQSALDTLAHFGIPAHTRPQAPGVYVGARKISSLGLRICRGCSLHGLALNINMDLQPFTGIHPCGDPHLQMCQMADWIPAIRLMDVQPVLLHHMRHQLGDCSGHRFPITPLKT
jgi:lipoyl(octanoyl) transferase